MSRWTDEELGILQDLTEQGWTAQEIGDHLGRTEKAIYYCRRKLRSGKPFAGPSWTEEELDFLRSTPYYTIEQHAKHLGRKRSTIIGVRQRLSKREGVRWDLGGAKNPHRIGRRTLLARTCPDCGLFLDASWFVRRKSGPDVGRWFAKCIRCCNPDTEEYRRKQAERAAKRREGEDDPNLHYHRVQAVSLQWATRARQGYTEDDMQVLSDPDLTVLEKSFRLKRSFAATSGAVRRFGFTSKVGRGEAVEGQWIIQHAGEVLMSA